MNKYSFQQQYNVNTKPRNSNENHDDSYDYEDDYYEKAPKVRKFREHRAR